MQLIVYHFSTQSNIVILVLLNIFNKADTLILFCASTFVCMLYLIKSSARVAFPGPLFFRRVLNFTTTLKSGEKALFKNWVLFKFEFLLILPYVLAFVGLGKSEKRA